MSIQNISRPISIDDGCSLKHKPVKKNMIAAASHGFHIFHAQTENLSLKKKKNLIKASTEIRHIEITFKYYLMLVGSEETISLIFSQPNVHI